MVRETWSAIDLNDNNMMVRFKKKLQILKKEIRVWVCDYKKKQYPKATARYSISESMNFILKAKIYGLIEGDENSKFFHGIINRKRANLAVKVVGDLAERTKDEVELRFGSVLDIRKAYDSIRCDYLDEVLRAFGFGSKWRSWIGGSLRSGMAFILLNRSPTSEFQFHYGLKQGDPLAPYLFIIIMESLHLSFSRAVDEGIFTIKIDSSLNISHLFYADDAMFIGEWSTENISGITHILHCFSLLSGLTINIKRVHLLGARTCQMYRVAGLAASNLGCSVMKTPFKYLGVMVGGNTSKIQAWDEVIGKLKARLSKWKLKTLSVGGRLTLLKVVLGSTPIYNMSIYKVPKSILHMMESLRRNFFNGVQADERNITWIKWPKVLASRKYGGLGVSSFYALNRALLFKWVWRFISAEKSLWCRFIKAMHGNSLLKLSHFCGSTWNVIMREVFSLKERGIDLISHCRVRLGDGLRTQFWNDVWVGDSQLRHLFPRLFALETNKDCSVASKIQSSVISTFRRPVRGGIETAQLDLLEKSIEGTILSTLDDRFRTRGVRFAFQPRKIRLIYFLAAVWPGMLPGWCVVGGMFRGLLFPRMQTGLCGLAPSG
ncbi:RNA-directed DNA polymerase, eukaryota [Tanacetum coccineum]